MTYAGVFAWRRFPIHAGVESLSELPNEMPGGVAPYCSHRWVDDRVAGHRHLVFE